MPRPAAVALIRFAGRQSLRMVTVVIALLLLLVLPAVQPASPWLSAGVFALVYAVPFAAARLLDLDRSGRLDSLRLAGHSPAQLLVWLLVGWVAPWLLLGAGALLAWFWYRPPDVAAVLTLTVLAAASVAISAASLALPRG